MLDKYPKKSNPNTVSQKEEEVIGRQLEQSFAQEFVWPSKFPWEVPVLLVGKKDGRLNL